MGVIYKNTLPLKNDARKTYHKLFRDLTKWGYLKYHPSTSPPMGSLVEMSRFDPHSDQKIDKTYPVSEQAPVQKWSLLINMKVNI